MNATLYFMKNDSKEQVGEFKFPESAEGFEELNREFSPCGKVVMVVGKRPDETYTYALYFWDLSEYEYIGSGYWAPCYEGGIFSDLESAIREAKQSLLSRSVQGEI